MENTAMAFNQQNNPLQKSQISKQLRTKANEFLNSRRQTTILLDIIEHLRQNLAQKQSVSAVILTLEVIFAELLKRREMCIKVTPLKPKDVSPEAKYREWLRERFEDTLQLLLNCIVHEKNSEGIQALTSSMRLLSLEGKFPYLDTDNVFPKVRLRCILSQLVSNQKSQHAVIQRFKEYTSYVDVVYHSWRVLPLLSTRVNFQNSVHNTNFFELVHTLRVTKELHEQHKLLCGPSIKQLIHIAPNPTGAVDIEPYDYEMLRKYIEVSWNTMRNWQAKIDDENVLKQLLILLLERILPHLEKPILLTDFLMDSLDCGGAIALLALQGLFTLIQNHNITYPNIYEKLYSMFEPEIFHTKYKARLFYLADIFLSSTHLPEKLVAAFAKRLARLATMAEPQDVIIILQFIGNLMLRHAGLKRLIRADTAAELPCDPYVIDERDPAKSNALESSLWEIIWLQKYAIPTVATAAKTITQSLPSMEFDLSAVLELKEDDIFDQEISKKTKQYAMAFERPNGLLLPRPDNALSYWKLY